MTRAAQTKMSSSQFWTAQMSRSFQGHDQPDKANKRSWIRAKQRWIPLRIYKLTWSYQWACYQSLASDCSEHITKPAVTWMTWYSHATSFSWVVELVWVFLGRKSKHMFIQDKEIIEASISIIKSKFKSVFRESLACLLYTREKHWTTREKRSQEMWYTIFKRKNNLHTSLVLI